MYGPRQRSTARSCWIGSRLCTSPGGVLKVVLVQWQRVTTRIGLARNSRPPLPSGGRVIGTSQGSNGASSAAETCSAIRPSTRPKRLTQCRNGGSRRTLTRAQKSSTGGGAPMSAARPRADRARRARRRAHGRIRTPHSRRQAAARRTACAVRREAALDTSTAHTRTENAAMAALGAALGARAAREPLFLASLSRW